MLAQQYYKQLHRWHGWWTSCVTYVHGTHAGTAVLQTVTYIDGTDGGTAVLHIHGTHAGTAVFYLTHTHTHWHNLIDV